MNKKGVAFLTTIILLGIIVIATTALSLVLLRDVYSVKRLKRSTQAYCLAEAGIEEAIEDLWRNEFDLSRFPIGRDLANGKIAVTLDTSRWATENIVLIISKGLVGDTYRTIKTAVITAEITPNYVVLANKKLWVADGGVVNCGQGEGIHSNDNSESSWNSRAALEVGGIFTAGTVVGDASAVGEVYKRPTGAITGAETSGADSNKKLLAVFDQTFFNYYSELAKSSGTLYKKTQVFTTNLSPASGVVYVNGDVYIEGNVTLDGCIVATRNIYVNIFTDGTFTQRQVGNLPALMSTNKSISIWDPATLNGLVYAGGDVNLISLVGTPRNVQINGQILAQGAVNILNGAEVNYIKQAPAGLGVSTGTAGWVLSWDE